MSKDTIYREDAIEALNECTDIKGFKYTQMHNALIEIPSADRLQGEWIDRSGGIEGAWNYCSVCGEQAIDLYDFCPNCGADMRNCSEIPNNYEPQTCENRGCKNYDTINDHCMFIEQCHYKPKDETSKENCELQTKQQTKRPWGMYIIEHPMYE